MAFQVRDHRGGNWFWLHNVIVDRYGAELGVYGVAVYVALCRHAGQDQQTWVSQGRLAAELGTSRQQVNKTVARLQALGLIGVEDRQDDTTGRTTSTYTLLPPVAHDDRGVALSDSPGHPGRQHGPAALIHENKTQGTRPVAPYSAEYYARLIRRQAAGEDGEPGGA